MSAKEKPPTSEQLRLFPEPEPENTHVLHPQLKPTRDAVIDASTIVVESPTESRLVLLEDPEATLHPDVLLEPDEVDSANLNRLMGSRGTVVPRPKPTTPTAAPTDRERLRATASRALARLDLLVPKRISNEEVGDSLELIDQMVREGRPRWWIYLKIATTCFWVIVHAAHAVLRGVPKKTGG